MSSLLFLLAAFAMAALGTAVIVMRARQPKSVEAGVRAFSREMRALDPESRRGLPGPGNADEARAARRPPRQPGR